MANATENKGAFIPAAITFLVVTGAIYITGLAATWVLRHVLLPALSLIVGFLAARVVYKIRD